MTKTHETVANSRKKQLRNGPSQHWESLGMQQQQKNECSHVFTKFHTLLNQFLENISLVKKKDYYNKTPRRKLFKLVT